MVLLLDGGDDPNEVDGGSGGPSTWNTVLELPYVYLNCKRKAIYSFYPLSPVHNIPSTLALTLPDRTFGGWLVMPVS